MNTINKYLSASPIAARLVLCLLILGRQKHSAYAAANDLQGGTGAARSTASTLDTNPANAAKIQQTELILAPNLYQKSSFKIRYPGSLPLEKSSSGTGDVTSFLPKVALKLSDSLGMGGYLVPPATINREFNGVHIVLLGALDYVAIKAKVTVKGAAGVAVGYQLNERLALGAELSYQGYTIDADANPSGGGPTLATIFIESSTLNLKAGLTYTLIPERLSFGAAFDLYATQNSTTRLSTALLGAGSAGHGGQSSSSQATPLNHILLGAAAKVGTQWLIFADLDYHRAAPDAKDFSFVDLVEKNKDVHSTLAPRIASDFKLLPDIALLSSFRYEPASIGAGGKGENRKGGYGSKEVIGIFTGQDSLTPFWAASLGARHDFGSLSSARDSRLKKEKQREPRTSLVSPQRRPQRVAKWQLAYGILYQRASLGIDENGELPGAYLQTKIVAPIEIVYRL